MPYRNISGAKVLRDSMLNKGTAFTDEERDFLNIEGLLPPRVFTMEEQKQRVLENFHRKSSDLEKYIFLVALQERNKNLFYRTVIDNIDEMMPIIYTPTVGEACRKYAQIFRVSQGMYLSLKQKGRIARVLRNWPSREVGVIVVTDGERILGLGDLGANGMGIPVGKLSLYTACAGVHPGACLPILLDVGTNNKDLLADPLYMGLPQQRAKGAEYDEFVDEFMQAVRHVYPDALIQFEDFGNHNAFRFLHKYRSDYCTFNDDIQGTAAVTLAGLLSALRITGKPLVDQRLVVLGAGEAAIGIGDLVTSALVRQGVSEQEARERCWFLDSKGLVVKSRDNLQEHKLPYAHDHAFLPDLLSAVETLKPTAIIGVSGQPNTFTKEVVEAMTRLNDRPIVFALSNPTANAECTAEEAYQWSGGKAIFASGSPFKPVAHDGRTFVPGQANNAYIFPGVGLGVLCSQATRVVDEMFFQAASALAEQTQPDSLESGCLFPPLTAIRDVSVRIAVRVAEVAYKEGLARHRQPDDIEALVRYNMYEPEYIQWL